MTPIVSNREPGWVSKTEILPTEMDQSRKSIIGLWHVQLTHV